MSWIVVELLDRCGGSVQDRVTDDADGQDRHRVGV